MAAGSSVHGAPFAKMIWFQYLIQSPQADGLAQLLPQWVSPPRGADSLITRTLFSMEWLEPILLAVLVSILGLVNALSLGYVLFRITADTERLPFPLAPVQAAGATALAESSAGEETWRWRMFTVGAMIGLGWGILYVVVPPFPAVVLTRAWSLPIPFADFTPRFRDVLPASPIGIGTDMATLLVGFVLPFWIVVGTFISSFVITFIANPLLYHFGLLHSWTPGMSTIPTSINNTIDFWLSFSSIGTSLVIGLIGLVAFARALRRDPDGASGGQGPRKPPPERGDFRLPIPIALWAVSTLCFIALVYYLEPAFPVWISVVSVSVDASFSPTSAPA